MVFEPDGTGRVTWPREADQWSMAGLKVRGSSTAGYPKKPYRLETWAPESGRLPGPPVDEELPLLGMPADGDWVLGAPLDFDRARMRTTLVYQVSRAIGRYAARTRFAEVFVAERGERVGMDDYVGLYEVTEHLERANDRIDVERMLPTDLTEPAVTGGWVFKEDRTGPDEQGFRAGDAGGRLSFQQPFVYVDPSEDVVAPEQAAWLSTYLNELGVALVAPGFTHPVTGHHYDDLIDTDAFIDHHILNVWAKNPDAIRLSGYLHKDREGLLVAGPVWDFDRTMGCASDSRAANPTWWDATNETRDTTAMFDEGFYGGLFDDPVFRDRYFARMDVLLRTALDPVGTTYLLEGWAAEIDEAAARDFDRWTQYPPRGGSLRTEVDLLEDWLQQRHAWMSACLLRADPMGCRGN
ncbi:MAG: CotH kinase family protein [Alphaproteobacteria bacterium]|nr:CotH kinase family protein [Alphaproteobacteria bacterium]MCB9696723.1 CotH kinase family protein [Alphaproteobacteria bacterium]